LTTVTNTVLDVGSTSATMSVLDNDGPTLSVSIPGGAITEGGMRQGTVTRNTSTTNPLVVTLTSGDTTEITVPATVTIPAGAASVQFTVTAVVDGVSDGLQTTTVVASATGFNSGSASASVSDVDLPDLQIQSITVPTAGRTGQQIPVSYTVINNGIV